MIHRVWPNMGLPGELSQELATPKHFEQAAAIVTEEMVADTPPCGPTPSHTWSRYASTRRSGTTRSTCTRSVPTRRVSSSSSRRRSYRSSADPAYGLDELPACATPLDRPRFRVSRFFRISWSRIERATYRRRRSSGRVPSVCSVATLSGCCTGW
jgi:hypothetical protein